jgi:hypothetical protein
MFQDKYNYGQSRFELILETMQNKFGALILSLISTFAKDLNNLKLRCIVAIR